MPSTRHQIRKAHASWYVIDTTTGRIWAGLTHPGARQLADRLNRAA